jgi:hypothetical protein
MAYAIMGGLAVATVLTLIFLPALYVAWFRIRPQPEAENARDGSRAPRDGMTDRSRVGSSIGAATGSA